MVGAGRFPWRIPQIHRPPGSTMQEPLMRAASRMHILAACIDIHRHQVAVTRNQLFPRACSSKAHIVTLYIMPLIS